MLLYNDENILGPRTGPSEVHIASTHEEQTGCLLLAAITFVAASSGDLPLAEKGVMEDDFSTARKRKATSLYLTAFRSIATDNTTRFCPYTVSPCQSARCYHRSCKDASCHYIY